MLFWGSDPRRSQMDHMKKQEQNKIAEHFFIFHW